MASAAESPEVSLALALAIAASVKISAPGQEESTYQLSRALSWWSERATRVAMKSCLQDVSCSQACVSGSSHQTGNAINFSNQHLSLSN